MNNYIALLRSINVGGNNKLAMADLRSGFSALGYENVRTYIQSGNVLFQTQQPISRSTVDSLIADQFGISTTTVLCTPSELKKVIAENPYRSLDLSKVHFGFFVDSPTPKAKTLTDDGTFSPETFHVSRKGIYLYLPNGMATTKVPSYVARKLAVAITFRNWNTISKLYELATDSSQ